MRFGRSGWLLFLYGLDVQSQQVQMRKSYFQAKDSQDLSLAIVQEKISAKTSEDASIFLQQLRKLPGTQIPRASFEYVVKECKSLYGLREAVNLVITMKATDPDDDQQMIRSLSKQLESIKDQMNQQEREMIEKIMQLSQQPRREGKLERYVRSLYNYSQENSLQYQKEVQEALQNDLQEEEQLRTILERLYQAVRSIEWSKGEVQALTSAKLLYEDDRRRKQDTIKQLEKELETIHQKYLEKYKILVGLLPHDGNQQEEEGIQQANDERQNGHLFNKLQNFLQNMNNPSKQALILDEIDQSITNFLQSADFPEAAIKIIAQIDSLKEKILCVIQTYSKILSMKNQELQLEKTAYILLKEQWQASSQKNKILVADMQSLKKNNDDLKREKEQLTTKNIQLKAHNTELQNTNQTLLDTCAQKDQTIQREQQVYEDRLKEMERIRQQSLDILQGKLKEAKEIILAQQQILAAKPVIRSKVQSQIQQEHEQAQNQVSSEPTVQEPLMTNKEIEQLIQICSQLQSSQKQLQQALKEKQQIMESQAAQVEQMLAIQRAELQKNISTILQQNQALTQALTRRNYNAYFPNQILFGQQHKKQFLVTALEQQSGEKISWTRLLFRWDRLNKNNFHLYIDNIPDILVLVKLKNGRIVAGYTHHPIVHGCKGGENGLLLSVTTEQVFRLRAPNKTVFYDEYYIILGNSELRLKSGEDLIYSNFGISNSYFECGPLNVDALFGEGKEGKELPIETYEIYQLIFKP